MFPKVVPISSQGWFIVVFVNRILLDSEGILDFSRAQFQVHANLLSVQICDEHFDEFLRIRVHEAYALITQFHVEMRAQVVKSFTNPFLDF